MELDLDFYLNEIGENMGPSLSPKSLPAVFPEAQKEITVLLTQPFIGAPDKLGNMLLGQFLQSLSAKKLSEKRLVLMHQAVKLASPSSPLNHLVQHFAAKNGIVLVCELSAQQCGLLDEINVGKLVSCESICQSVLSTWKVIRL